MQEQRVKAALFRRISSSVAATVRDPWMHVSLLFTSIHPLSSCHRGFLVVSPTQMLHRGHLYSRERSGNSGSLNEAGMAI